MILMQEVTNNTIELIDLIVSCAMLFVVTIGLLSLRFQKRGIRFSTMQKCIDDHRRILRKQQSLLITKGSCDEHLILVRDHLGLVTEELFYMRKGFLSKKVAKSWINHMIEFIPISVSNDKVINETRIMRSREVGHFIKSLDLSSANPDEKLKFRESKYSKYIEIALEKESFSKINLVFCLNRNSRVCKSMINYDFSNLNDSQRKKLVKYFFRKNRKCKGF